MKGLKRRRFFIKLSNWEYWPSYIVYVPLYIYFVWLSIKARSLWFWSASNPGIETGGMLGESKIEIFNNIPENIRPVTLLIKTGTSLYAIQNILNDKGINFPIICKPDRGERGFQVAKITNENDLRIYIEKNKVDYIIQPYCEYKMELGVYFCRFPWEEKGFVFSVVKKEFLHVTGDGIHTLRELVLNNDRAVLQWSFIEAKFDHRLGEVLKEGEVLELVPIGNHARGTKFIDGRNMIDERLNNVFDSITKQIQGVYFARYDLRTTSEEDLKQGKNIFLIELNGVGAEPAHIYDPSYRLVSAWRDLVDQWKMVYAISTYNKKQGAKYMTTKEIRSHLKMMKAYRILAES